MAKLMTKLDKKRKLIKKLEQQIEKAEVEMADTKKSIRALAAKFRVVLDMHDGDQDQTRDEIVASDAESEGYQSRDDDVSEVSSLESEVSEDESEWGVSELAGFYNSEQLKRLEQVISETMGIETQALVLGGSREDGTVDFEAVLLLEAGQGTRLGRPCKCHQRPKGDQLSIRNSNRNIE